MNGKELNENDNKLLAYCLNRRRHLSDIARELKIDVKNVSVRIKDLENAGLIKSELIGNKKYIRTTKGDKTKEHFLEILRELKTRGGEIKEDEFINILSFLDNGEVNEDKFSAPMKLMYAHPKLVERYIKISDEGLRFLERNSR